MITIKERAQAIRRAKIALQTLGEEPTADPRELGASRERLNDCYRLSDPERVRAAAEGAESIAARVGGRRI